MAMLISEQPNKLNENCFVAVRGLYVIVEIQFSVENSTENTRII